MKRTIPLLALATVAGVASAQTYSLRDLGTPTTAEAPLFGNLSGFALNDAGVAVGDALAYDDSGSFPFQRGFRSAPGGTAEFLAPLGGSTSFDDFSFASGINASGLVVGGSTVNGSGRAVAWINGVASDLGLPSGATDAGATDVNDAGTATGFAVFESGDRPVVFSGGTATALALPSTGGVAASTAQGQAINGAGAVLVGATVGNRNRSFLFANGAYTDLGLLPGGNTLSAIDLNGSGVAVGFGNGTAGTRAFTSQGGTATILAGPTGATTTRAFGINDGGLVVGESILTGLPRSRATLFEGTIATDLNTLLDASGASWELLSAQDVNASGQIVGFGRFYTNSARTEFEIRGFALTPNNPVPEPATLAALGLGALGLMRRRRAKCGR